VQSWIQGTLFDVKQEAARESGARYYGDGGTIHGTHTLDIELDEDGNVASVWFRCQLLPFRTWTRSGDKPCRDNPDIWINGIEIQDTHP
jgi:hypothetical protein